MPARDFFIYSVEFLPINASSTAVANIPIQADSAFELAELAGDVRALVTDEAPIAGPALLISLVDQGTGRLLMDRPQIFTNFIGTAQRPFLLPIPKTFNANATIQVSVQNLAVANRNVRISFIGYKIFP